VKYLIVIGCVVVGLAILIPLLLVVNLLVNTVRQAWRIARKVSAVVDPIQKGQPPDLLAIREIAANPEFRNELFEGLEGIGRSDLFPKEYRTLPAIAESALVSWLAHPNELQQAPDEIELHSEHVLESEIGPLRYFLYKFRTRPPSFAAENGWMAGTSGPFLDRPDGRFVPAKAMMSELEPFDSRLPEEHVKCTHESVVRGGVLKRMIEARKT